MDYHHNLSVLGFSKFVSIKIKITVTGGSYTLNQ